MNDILSSPLFLDGPTFGLRVALSGLAICAVVLFAARLLQRRSEPLRYGILLSGVVALLAAPALVGVGQVVPVSWLQLAVEPIEEIITVHAEPVPANVAPLPEAPSNEAPVEAVAPSLVGPVVDASFLILWVLGVMFGLCRLGVAMWKLRRLLLGQPWHADFWTEQRQAQLAAQLGLKRFPAVYLSPAAPMPMVVGILRPVIVLPEQAPATWEQPQWEAVLLHEAAHIARRDPWAALAQRVAVILFWWCPLVHLVGRRLNDLREHICDDFALAGPCDQVTYAELLVETAERLLSLKALPVPLGLLDSARGGLEARISRLLKKERRPMTKLSWPGKLLGGGVLAAACLLTAGGAALSGAQAQPEPTKKVQIKILVDGKEIDLDAKVLEALQPAAPNPVENPLLRFGVRSLEGAGTPARLEPTPAGQAPDDPKAKGNVVVQVVAAPPATAAQPKDPRIEELVEQAERIKKGSGDAVRRALQGDPRNAGIFAHPPQKSPPIAEHVYRYTTTQATPKPALAQYQFVQPGSGQKIIVLTVEDGKVKQLTDSELRILLDKSRSIVVDTKADPKVTAKTPTMPKAIEVRTAPAPAPAGSEIDMLRRQLERINAELELLRKRIDSGAK